MVLGRIAGQQRKALARNMALWVITTASTLSAGCGVRGGAPPVLPGHVSEANQACATLFCSAEAQSDPDSAACSLMQVRSLRVFRARVRRARRSRATRREAPEPGVAATGRSFRRNAQEDDDSPAYCAAISVDASPAARTYRLKTFPTERAARAAGGQVTHRGRCGACSSFQDLATYIERRNLNRAGRLWHARDVRGQDAIQLPEGPRLHRRSRPDSELQHRKHAREVHGDLRRHAPHEAQAAGRETQRLPRVRLNSGPTFKAVGRQNPPPFGFVVWDRAPLPRPTRQTCSLPGRALLLHSLSPVTSVRP